MGASVSICNLTFIAVNVALKHLGPLYYSNHLMPSDCVTFKPGKVWFTVEVRVWKNGTNDYTDAMAALPIVGLHQAIGAIGGAVPMHLGARGCCVAHGGFSRVPIRFST